MYKINLHSHSRNSDGANSVLEMAKECKELGHCACVITDHSFHKEGYKGSYSEARMIKEHNLIDIPIIVGCEINTVLEEFLLFGRRAILLWLRNESVMRFRYYKDAGDFKLNKNAYINMFCSLFSEYDDYAMITCHPVYKFAEMERKIQKQISKTIHGFEMRNSGQYQGDDVVEDYKKLGTHIKPYTNTDAHCVESLEDDYNITEYNISNENELITAIRNGVIYPGTRKIYG